MSISDTIDNISLITKLIFDRSFLVVLMPKKSQELVLSINFSSQSF